MRTIIKKHGAQAGLTLLLALVFALIFMGSNSPLGPAIGSDNAIYLTMGTALRNGYAPYTEVFDHKGPVLFLIETIPQLLCGGYSTLVVFVQETLYLWGCLFVIGLIAQKMKASALPAQLAFLLMLAPIIDGGNYCEEYTNLFTLAGMAVLLRMFDRDEWLQGDKSFFLPAGAVGSLFMLAFLTRANNALVLMGAVGGAALWLLIKRRFALVGCCAAGFLLGCALVAAPIAVWLQAQGALGEAIYASFTHNMMYAETAGQSRMQMLLMDSYGHIAIVMALLAVAGAACHYADTRRAAVSLSMVFGAAGAGLAAFISHKFYSHYLMLSAPLGALGVVMIARHIRARQIRLPRLAVAALAVCMAAAFVVNGVRENDERAQQHEIFVQLEENTDALLAHVPQTERDDLLAYRVEPKWYVAAEAMPYLRFYFLQEILGWADPAVMDEIADSLASDPPKWLVLFYNRPYSPEYDPRVQEIFDTRYEFVDAKGEYQLLRLKEE